MVTKRGKTIPKYAAPAAIELANRQWPSRTLAKSPAW